MPSKTKDWPKIGSGKTYFHRVHYPLQCLIFISPLLLFYQIASVVPAITTNPQHSQVVAFILMLNFFNYLGIFGSFLPMMAVVVILLCWHLARKDPWEFDLRLYGGMAIESIVWGIPFYIIGLAVARHIPIGAAGSPPIQQASWSTDVVLSVGAGVYEEFLFRYVAFALLHLILVDIFEMKEQIAIPIIIVASAAGFSAYHYMGTESFTMGSFLFRFAMGIYLAGVYYFRGYGITVGTHTVYDLIVVTLSRL